MVWPLVAAAAIGAAGSIAGSNSAANAQEDAAKKSAEASRRNMLLQLGLAEPSRNLGYQAQADLADMFGYTMSPYPTQNELVRGITPLASKTVKKGLKGGMGVDALSQMGTLGQLKPRAMRRLQRAGLTAEDIQQLQGMNSPAQTAEPATQPAGQAGNMSRFFTSPDYQFRRDEGQRDIGNSFAARGGAASGNALKALTEFNSNLASGEFGNYYNRLTQMAGMGTAGTNQASQAANIGTNNLMQSQQQQGDARASGVLGAANGAVNAVNTGIQNWQVGKYLQGQNRMNGLYVPEIWQKRL